VRRQSFVAHRDDIGRFWEGVWRVMVRFTFVTQIIIPFLFYAVLTYLCIWNIVILFL
jgi:hypothetical protein